ncbi:MAG: HsdR family type I site-specific deoxyribonuclease [Andreesenia angusta]|nr:HsdR family type I site-specific deoxyribonuclease [Andreesenia angusta]
MHNIQEDELIRLKKDSSEKAFQEKFVRELEKYRWEAPDYLNGNIRNVTVDDLIEHWRSELNRINADQLEGIKLTDNEFAQVMTRVSQISNSYEAAKLLAIEGAQGKIDGIYRDDNPKLTRKQITLTIFKKSQVSGGDSSYRIAREVRTGNNNRFDIVLLINGLPLINIEQKRTDKSLDEAFEQFKRYYRDGEYMNNFMAFSQMMVITTEIETRYFATPKSLDEFNKSFVFKWADKENNPINAWEKVIEHFLMIPMAHQMVGDYLVIDEARDEENRRHMLMRPYQVYALQAVKAAVYGERNEGIPHGGFVWHTTGSGKTITSFKTALVLSTRAGFDKVIFLVDRRELDSKTSEKFKDYSKYETVDVDDTASTYKLRQKLKSKSRGIVVTTTFKLNVLVKELVESKDYSLADKKIVFIIDEAHRTTMGNMMGNIKNYFRKKGLFYGFTGTPLFEENRAKGKINEKSEVINTTEKLFGPKLHEYTIDQAIADGNVLGFNIDYINTGEFRSYEDLRENIVEDILSSDGSDRRDIERKVYAMSELEVEKEAKKRKILKYQDETHIPRVVEEILKNWDKQSQQKKFNAILTVAYKERVIEYYEEFKRQLDNSDYKINIAMTFSFGNENDPDNISRDIIEKMFKDYEKITNVSFTPGDRRNGEDAYFEHIVDRATRGGSGRNPKNIDLVIVADQLLTGYDSKLLNTLYVDRALELQGLIQAYSRTNRVYGRDKEFGTIINFKYPRITEENVKEALVLYGSGGKNSRAIVDKYEIAVDKLSTKIKKLVNVLDDPTRWEEVKNDEEKKREFRDAFKEASEQYNLVTQYYEYNWDENKFGIDENTWDRYKGAVINLREDLDEEVYTEAITPLVSKTKLAGSQIIDAAYILKLISERVDMVDGYQTIKEEALEEIYRQIEELSNMGDDKSAKLLKEYVETELVLGNISSEIDFDESFEKWKKKKQRDEVKLYAEEWGADYSLICESVDNYSLTKPDNIPYVEEIFDSLDLEKAKNKSGSSILEHNMNFNENYAPWLKKIKNKYK